MPYCHRGVVAGAFAGRRWRFFGSACAARGMSWGQLRQAQDSPAGCLPSPLLLFPHTHAPGMPKGGVCLMRVINSFESNSLLVKGCIHTPAAARIWCTVRVPEPAVSPSGSSRRAFKRLCSVRAVGQESVSHISPTCSAQHHDDRLVPLAGKVSSAACGATAMQLDQQKQEDHCSNHPCPGWSWAQLAPRATARRGGSHACCCWSQDSLHAELHGHGAAATSFERHTAQGQSQDASTTAVALFTACRLPGDCRVGWNYQVVPYAVYVALETIQTTPGL
jgi:hypothetical protein